MPCREFEVNPSCGEAYFRSTTAISLATPWEKQAMKPVAQSRFFCRNIKRQERRHLPDKNATNCDSLPIEHRQIGKFLHWQRLVIIKQAFDDSEPKTIRQWWEDRRKPVQWYNFWLAVTLIAGRTIFFGLVQSIEGALQVYKAYRPF